jgi:hypothetical protein
MNLADLSEGEEDAALPQQTKQLTDWDAHSEWNARPRRRTSTERRKQQTELRGRPGKTTVSSAATAFKPEPFTGKRHDVAENWWKKLREYLRLADVDDSLFCSLTRLLLTEEAETWFNFLPEPVQRSFPELELAFKHQYVRPHNEKLTRLTELRGRVQGTNEPLRQFLVEIGSKLKSIGYDRDLWLDLIFPALRSELQAAISSFGAEGIKSFDSLLENSEKMERIASALERKHSNPMFNNIHTNTILQDKLPTDTQTDTTFQNKLTSIEQTLSQIALLENKRQERKEKK